MALLYVEAVVEDDKAEVRVKGVLVCGKVLKGLEEW
jgi:hypothetical protein